MIDLSEKTVAIWYILLDSGTDWIAGITELVENEEYLIQYRFRYYEDNKVFESKDRKNWYEGTTRGTKNYVLGCFKTVARDFKILSLYPESFFELINEGDFKDFMKKLQDAPFSHARMATSEEVKKFHLDKSEKKQ